MSMVITDNVLVQNASSLAHDIAAKHIMGKKALLNINENLLR
jgi:hypothetical protein